MEHTYSIQIEKVNGSSREQLASRKLELEHICKGGFRFITDERFELEDRIDVLLSMPDDSIHSVFGRICYTDSIDDERNVYGFSILKGFYTLDEPSTDPVAA